MFVCVCGVVGGEYGCVCMFAIIGYIHMFVCVRVYACVRV
jgi:hypothetical protein